MTQSETKPRYGVYYTPRKSDPLWEKGSTWLGRDAFANEPLLRPDVEGFSDQDINELTSSPRRYGFHSTLKAPFELSEAKTEDELLEFAQAFAAKRSSFRAKISPQALGKFVALRLDYDPNENMTELHTACVKDFEPFRASMTDADIARRRKSNLSPEQDALMLKWGYPYIFDGFRFHITQSNKIQDEDLRNRFLSALNKHYDGICDDAHLFDGIGIYKQNSRDSEFFILERFAFGK